MSDLTDCGIIGSQRRGRNHFHHYGYTLELTGCSGDVEIPSNVGELHLVIPVHGDSEFNLKGMADLKSLEVRHTFGNIPNAVCRIRIGDSPQLERIRLDVLQKFALEIENAPQLWSLAGFSNTDREDNASLTELKLSGPIEMEQLCLNLTHLNDVYLKGEPGQMHVWHMQLKADLANKATEMPTLMANDLQKFISKLSAVGSTDSLELDGLVCNDATLRSLPMVGRALSFRNCVFQDDVVDDSLDHLSSIVDLEIDNLSATSRQVADLRRRATNYLLINRGSAFKLDAVFTAGLPSVVGQDEYVNSMLFKVWLHLAERTQLAQRTKTLGTFDLQVVDPQNIKQELYDLIDDARNAGLTVRINPSASQGQ